MIIRKTWKRLILTIISTLIALLISFSVAFVLQKNKKECPQGYYIMDMSYFVTADGVDYDSLLYYVEGLISDFAAGKVTTEEINAFAKDMETTINSVGQFAIYSKEALSEWASDMEDGDFANINVKLMADIDFEGSGFCVRNFAATFDGNGHTISNIEFNGNIESSFVGTDGKEQGSVSKIYSLFLSLPASATIKNLRLYQCGRINDGGISGKNFVVNDNYEIKTVAGLVGHAQGCKIQNCVIEDFIVDTKDSTGYINVSGVFAVGHAYIENCLVQGMEVQECNETSGIGPVNYYVKTSSSSYTSIYTKYYYAFDLGPSDIYGCVVNNDSSKILSKKHNEYAPETYLEPGYYSGGDGPETLYYRHSIRSCYSTDKNGFNGLDKNYWHKSPGDEYNNGWPYLSTFIIFDVFTFEPYDATTGHITLNNVKQDTVVVKVPRVLGLTPSESASFVFYGQAITAVPIGGYLFTQWANSSSNLKSYRAFFHPENYTLKFATIGGVAPKMYHVIEPDNMLDSVGTYYAGTITYETKYEGGRTITTYKVGFSFIVEYNLDGKYIFTDYGISSLVENSIVKNLENNGTYTITPTLEKKSYSITFG